MSGFNIKLSGLQDLESELNRLNSVRWDAVKQKQLTEILNRARSPGGTPVDTGELRLSSRKSKYEVGYTAEYAPHVEYGHRTINGGYVKGQRFFQKNVDRQREIYKTDLRRALRNERSKG